VGELSASIAHELNQPLAAILSNTQAAQRFMAAGQPDLAEVREILKDVAGDTARARDVIRQLRALVNNREPDFISLDLGRTVRDVVGFLHGDILTRHVRVVLQLSPGLPPVRGDRTQLQQVLINLMLNAFDAMQSNPVSERLVTVSTSLKAGPFVCVAVRDRGPGIPEDKLDVVFEPFFTTKSEGMGVGLCVSRSIIEAHGGRLWAENNADRGAVFHFTLHIAETL
jgi:two-component system sensor kinase FixL